MSEGEVQHSAFCRSVLGTSPTTWRWCCGHRLPRPSGSRSARLLSGRHGGRGEGSRFRPSQVARHEWFPKTSSAEILQPRAEEMLTLVRDDLMRQSGGTRLCGGRSSDRGGAQLDGLLEMAEADFQLHRFATACRRVWEVSWTSSAARPGRHVGLYCFTDRLSEIGKQVGRSGFTMRGMVSSFAECFQICFDQREHREGESQDDLI